MALALLAVSSPSMAAAEPAPFKGVGGSPCDDLRRFKVTWWYNWYVDPGGCDVGEFVPMVSGKDKHGVGDIAWQRDRAIERGYKTLLGFNEPDKADQANMSVATAVSLWPTLTADPSVRIGSPATAGSGQAWFTEFMKQVAEKNLRVDFIALHWYGWNAGSCDAKAAQLENYIRWAESFPGNRPIWITEFGCMNQSNPDMATVNSFYKAALEVFARHPRIERYAWYPWNTHNELVGADGALTSLGTAFANAPGTRGGNTSGGDVTLVNRATGKCLDVNGGSAADGTDVIQWTCHGGTNQRWRIEDVGDGTKRLVNAATGKALDVAGCGTADNTDIRQWTWLNNGCQRWVLDDTGGGWVRLRNPGSGKVAGVADCDRPDVSDVRLWTWRGDDCQQWQVRS